MNTKTSIRNPSDCLPLIQKYASKRQEHFGVILLDGAHNVITTKILFKGTVRNCVVSPREIFRYALLRDAVDIIVFHNHPSQTTDMNSRDLNTTKKLIEAGQTIGIALLDHLVIGKYSYLSYAEITDLFSKTDTLEVANGD